MADQDSGADKTEDPTPKKLADARNNGDVPRSRELNTVLMLLASIVGFAFLGGNGVNAYKRLAISQWQIDRVQIFADNAVLNALFVPLMEALRISVPFLILMFLAAFIGPVFMGGWVCSVKSLKFDLKKLNPITGIAKMLGIQSLVELLKGVLKVILLGSVSVLMFMILKDDYIRLASISLSEAVQNAFTIMFIFILMLVTSLGIVALVDIPYQKWSYTKKHRMTVQEVRDENKQQNGNPEIKSKIRQMQLANANRKMLVNVPTADVIIVNPTHYSIALKYDDELVAPIVVAKGVDEMAMRIREIARHSDITVFSAPELARSLYRHSDVGETIPSELYLAVAQVLAYVLQVKEASFSDRRRLQRPVDLPIPKPFQDNDKN